MTSVINKDIICDYINYDGLNKQQLCSLINRWKRLLFYKYGAQKGQILAIATAGLSHNHLACIFAGAEMGMRLMIVNKPVSKETISSTKLAQFGPVDIIVHQLPGITIDNLMIEAAVRYAKQICWEPEVESVLDDSDVYTGITVEPEDPLLFTSTSGTTGSAKAVHKTHSMIYEESVANIKRIKFTKESVVLQNSNMHHMSAMVVSIIPPMMISEKHLTHSTPIIDNGYEDSIIERYVIGHGLNKMMLQNKIVLDNFLASIRKYKDRINHTIEIALNGFPMTQEYYDVTKELPVTFISGFGTAETGGFLFNYISADSTFKPNYLGKLDSDNYSVELTEDGTYVSGRFVDGKVKINDKFTVVGDDYFYSGRTDENALDSEILEHIRDQVKDFSYLVGSKRYLVVWDIDPIDLTDSAFGRMMKHHIDSITFLRKKDFIVDTKISMEQLLAYLDFHHGEE